MKTKKRRNEINTKNTIFSHFYIILNINDVKCDFYFNNIY